LYSLAVSQTQCKALAQLVEKKEKDIHFALIENAADIVPNSREWLGGFREMWRSCGYQLHHIDLRNWLTHRKGLYEALAAHDVIWVGGGHTYYLRWLLKATGADQMIQSLVANGKVYAGWSAGAVAAGPTLQHFEEMGDDPREAPEVIQNGLHLTDTAIIPHIDHTDFGKEAAEVERKLRTDGFRTCALKDNQVMIINSNHFALL